MKKLVLAITIAVMAFSGIAVADTYMDNVGVYFDTAGTVACMDNIETSGIGVHHVYLVFTKLTNNAVMGFELNLAFDGPLVASNFVFPAGSGAINLQTAPTFLVGFGTPITVVDRTAVIMEFDILAFSVNPVNWDANGQAHVYVKEIFFHSLPEEVPAYLNGSGEIIALHQSTGIETDPVMVFSLAENSCEGIVATDETSWDGLKSLYR